MTSVSLFDCILLRRRSDHEISLSEIPGAPSTKQKTYSMPLNKTNLVWQAINLLREQTGQRFGLDVAIQKNIPAQAGMGGGSSDAAATLVGVNRLFGLGLQNSQLVSMATQLGSDVAFFIGNRAARCLGRGELINPLRLDRPVHFVVAMPPEGLSTADVYSRSRVPDQRASSDALLVGLRKGDLRRIGSGLRNRLQSAAERVCPWIGRMKDEFDKTGCYGHQVTGSGAGYFGVFGSQHVAARVRRKIAARLPTCSLFCISTVGNEANRIRYRAE